MSKQNRETPCSCGSGKKYKKCCMIKKNPRQEGHAYGKPGEKKKLWHRENWQ